MKLRAGGTFDAARARLRAGRWGSEPAAPADREPSQPMDWHVQDMGARVDVADNEAVLAALEGQ